MDDETCKKCGAVFNPQHHFVCCYLDDCPMSSGGTVLDIIPEGVDKNDKPE